MALRNGPAEFGLVTRVIHWAMMLLVIGQLALGNRIEEMQPGLANLWLYGLHKTLGFAILALILARPKDRRIHIRRPPAPHLAMRLQSLMAPRMGQRDHRQI